MGVTFANKTFKGFAWLALWLLMVVVFLIVTVRTFADGNTASGFVYLIVFVMISYFETKATLSSQRAGITITI